MSAAADWRRKLRLKAEGLCTICAKKQLQTVWRCADCAKRARESRRPQKRKSLGLKPWRPGGPGRPPIEATTP
jgi:hypothetical protein